MTAEKDKANFWAHGWMRKRHQFAQAGVDPLDLRAVHERVERALFRRRWAIRAYLSKEDTP